MKRFFTKFIVLLAVVTTTLADSRAQSSLSTGDIVFTSFDSRGTPAAGTDIFSFVLLTNISSNTQIRFTDRGYGGASWNADNGGSESAITWTSNVAMPIGTEIKIAGLTATVVSTSTPAGTVNAFTGSVGLSLAGLDQIIAYQGSGDVITATTLLAGIHWNNCSGNTNDANWDVVGPCSTITGTSGSAIPPGLSASVSAIWAGTTGGVANIAGRFECAGTPAATASAIRTAVQNRAANWSYITSTAQSITVPAGCTYYGIAAPLVTTNPSSAAICAGGNASFSVAATGATSYQWQVSATGTGGTYTNLSNVAPYSGVTGVTLSITAATAAMNGYAYRAAAINSGGTTYSSGALLTVDNGVPTIAAQPADAAICPGSTTILSGSASGGTISYKWQVNTGTGFTNITDGSIYNNSATPSLSIFGSTTSMSGYQYRLTATNNCGTSNSNAATLAFRTTWTGSTSTNWSTGTNWSCNVAPDANTDAIIPNISTQPVVSTTTAAVRNLTINLGASLTINPSSTLTITGDVSNLGNISATAPGAMLAFNSANAQFIPPGTFFNIQVAGGGNKTLAGNVTITNNITFSSGKIFLGPNTLTMASTAGTPNASSASYVVTNGAGGYKRMGLTSGSIVFVIGTATDYTPFLLSNGGTADNFTGRVIDGVYNGYTNDIPNGSPISSNVVNKTWFVTEDVAGGSNATLTVQWNAADELPSFVRSASILAHYNNGMWQTQQPAAAGGSNPYTLSRSAITAFSPFGVGGVGSPLPVKLVSFTGRSKKEGVALDWNVADEQGIDRYQVERSDDGRNFVRIGAVKAAGTSDYSYFDRPLPGISRRYYRLNILELNGSSEYSNVITIVPENIAANEWIVNPNPARGDNLNISPAANSAAIENISIIDLSGRIWYQSVGNGAKAISVSLKSIPAGTYAVKLKTGASVQTIKLQRL